MARVSFRNNKARRTLLGAIVSNSYPQSTEDDIGERLARFDLDIDGVFERVPTFIGAVSTGPVVCMFYKKQHPQCTEEDIEQRIASFDADIDGLVERMQEDLQCPHCEKYFVQKADYQRHVRAVHEKQCPFKCPIVWKFLGRKST